MPMVTEKQALFYFSRISKSEGFANSETNVKLLKYLIKKSLAHEIPREMDIAVDFFGKGKHYNTSNDSLVRSHIWSLRKKLETYYLKKGRSDKIRLVIPKGRYEVVFTDNPTKEHKSQSREWMTFSIFFISLCMFAASAFLYFSSGQRVPLTEKKLLSDPVWQDFARSPLPTQFVLGDYFVYVEEKNAGSGWRRIRSGSVNSMEELREYYQKNPEFAPDFMGTTHTYLNVSLPVDMMTLLPSFIRSGIDVRYNNASWLTDQEFRNFNLIFLGPLKTLRDFETYLKKSSYDCAFYPHRLFVKDMADTTQYKVMKIELDEGFNYEKDYTLVLKMPGPNDNVVMVVSNFSPFALHTIVNELHSGEFAANVRENFLGAHEKFPRFFEALVEVNIVGDVRSSSVLDFRRIGDE